MSGAGETEPAYTIADVGWLHWEATDSDGKLVGFIVQSDGGPDRYEVGFPVGAGPSSWHPTVGAAKAALAARLDATLSLP